MRSQAALLAAVWFFRCEALRREAGTHSGTRRFATLRSIDACTAFPNPSVMANTYPFPIDVSMMSCCCHPVKVKWPRDSGRDWREPTISSPSEGSDERWGRWPARAGGGPIRRDNPNTLT
ncbi:hypothetical protein BMS3Bbin01_02819 [bacterium BMS3Bbin01]|nr:hypothetical protein BMS3Bbin01_02819 [bacterium BMS3Bbin01]